MPLDPGEAILVVTGLRRVLRGKRPTLEQLARSAKVEDELKAAVLGYLQGKRTAAPDPPDEEVPPEMPEDAHSAVEGLDPQVAMGYSLAAGRALQAIRQAVPRRVLAGLRDRPAQATETERARRRRAWAVVENPMAVLGDLRAMSDDQVTVLQTVYPTLWSALGLAAGEALAVHNKDPDSRQERVLGRLMGIQVADVAALQDLHAQPEKQSGGPSAGGGPQTTNVQTPSQKLAAQ
jgi:hypothetical protein